MTPQEFREMSERLSRTDRRRQSWRAVLIVLGLLLFGVAMLALRAWILANDT